MPRPPKRTAAAPDPDPASGEEAVVSDAAAADADAEATPGGVRSAPLQPIGSVRRELVRPDGTKVSVDVPVYPPFRLADDAGNVPKPPPPRRLRPGAKPRKTG